MIFNELQELKREFVNLKQEFLLRNIEELSLNRASKWVKKNPEFLKDEADSGRLKAIITKDDEGNKRYRFRVCDLYEWQISRVNKSEEAKTVHINPNWGKDFIKNFHKKNNNNNNKNKRG